MSREKTVGVSFSRFFKFATCGALLETTRLQALTVTRVGAFCTIRVVPRFSRPDLQNRAFFNAESIKSEELGIRS